MNKQVETNLVNVTGRDYQLFFSKDVKPALIAVAGLIGSLLLFIGSESSAAIRKVRTDSPSVQGGSMQKKTYMECQTTSKYYPRVVVKAERRRDVLSGFEVIVVNHKGKSSIFPSRDTLDGRYLDPATLEKKHILIVGNSKDTLNSQGLVRNGTSVSVFETKDAAEDMSCFSAQHRSSRSAQGKTNSQLSKALLNEIRYHKFSGVLHHKDTLIQLSCYSPMVPRSYSCDQTADSQTIRDEDFAMILK